MIAPYTALNLVMMPVIVMANLTGGTKPLTTYNFVRTEGMTDSDSDVLVVYT